MQMASIHSLVLAEVTQTERRPSWKCGLTRRIFAVAKDLFCVGFQSPCVGQRIVVKRRVVGIVDKQYADGGFKAGYLHKTEVVFSQWTIYVR
jgi:hypothetical protein